MERGSENIKILRIGVGGAGTNVVNRMKDIGVPNAEFLTFGGYHYDDNRHPEIQPNSIYLQYVDELNAKVRKGAETRFEMGYFADDELDDMKLVLSIFVFNPR